MPLPADDLNQGERGIWYPIENTDSQPFNPEIHYREKPHYVFAGDRVLRFYPVRLKTADEIAYEKRFERAS